MLAAVRRVRLQGLAIARWFRLHISLARLCERTRIRHGRMTGRGLCVIAIMTANECNCYYWMIFLFN